MAGSRSKVSAKSVPDLRESKLEREVAPVKVVKLNEREVVKSPKTLIEETEKIETKKVRRDSKSGQHELGSKVTKGRRHRGAWMLPVFEAYCFSIFSFANHNTSFVCSHSSLEPFHNVWPASEVEYILVPSLQMAASGCNCQVNPAVFSDCDDSQTLFS